MIEWLSWNDRNGVYRDDESLQEFGNTVSKEEAIENQQKKNSFTVNELKSWVHDFQN